MKIYNRNLKKKKFKLIFKKMIIINKIKINHPLIKKLYYLMIKS